MRQREIFSRGAAVKLAKQTWIDHTLEKSIVKVLMDALPLCGIMVHLILSRVPCRHCKTPSGKPVFHEAPSETGIADIGGLIPPKLIRGPRPTWGVPLYIEVKRPRGGVEGYEQAAFLESVRKKGGIAFFCRGLDQCCEELDAAGVIIPEAIWKPKPIISTVLGTRAPA